MSFVYIMASRSNFFRFHVKFWALAGTYIMRRERTVDNVVGFQEFRDAD
jgi:hypothetical protein